jgi:hypothetical protein
MSTQKELAKWNDAYKEFSKGNCNASLALYQEISYLSKISFNMGSIYTYLKDYDSALKCFNASIEADPYFLIALFQRGNCYFSTSRLQEAANDYNQILNRLTDSMDYTQLGIEYELYRAEVLFNRSLCYMGLGMKEKWQSDILEAKLYAGSMHQDAIQSHGFDSRIFMVKTGLQFQIPTWKLQSSKTWLTNAKSVHKTGFLGFLGSKVFDSTNVYYTQPRGHNFGTGILPEIHSVSPMPVNLKNPMPVNLKNNEVDLSSKSQNMPANNSQERKSSLASSFGIVDAQQIPERRSSAAESILTRTSTPPPTPPLRSFSFLNSDEDQTETYPHPKNETGEKMIYVAQFIDHSSLNPILTTLGIFQKKEKAVAACKNYVNTLMGRPVGELSPLDWMKGWCNGAYTVLISAQELHVTQERRKPHERDSLAK